MKDKIAIIGSGLLARVIAERARELDIETHCFSFDKTDLACNVVDYFYEVDIFDTDNISEICKENKISGVIPTTELTIYPAAAIAKNIGSLGNDLDVAKNITNKYYVRNSLKEIKELNQPKYWFFDDEIIPKIDVFPVIVKPVAAGGKRGVCVVGSQKEMEKAIEEALKYSRIKGVLIEEYINGGQEYSVESLTYKGNTYIIQITQKDTSGPPHCNELGHHQPADLSAEMQIKIKKIIIQIMDNLRFENGPCHTEIKILNDKVYLIEVNARPGGDHITHPLSELSTGYPTITGIILASLAKLEGNEPINLKKIPSGIYFITKQTSFLKPLFDTCEQYSWFYSKNKVSEDVSNIKFNDEEGINYFIYYGQKPDISEYKK